jgi:hypothetical protein
MFLVEGALKGRPYRGRRKRRLGAALHIDLAELVKFRLTCKYDLI